LVTCFFFLAGMMYRGLNSASTSTPIRAQVSSLYSAGISAADEGRSRICPIEDSTVKPGPRYLAIVLALAGDSTITRADRVADSRRTFRVPRFETLVEPAAWSCFSVGSCWAELRLLCIVESTRGPFGPAWPGPYRTGGKTAFLPLEADTGRPGSPDTWNGAWLAPGLPRQQSIGQAVFPLQSLL